jgi:hypothetical protein
MSNVFSGHVLKDDPYQLAAIINADGDDPNDSTRA